MKFSGQLVKTQVWGPHSQSSDSVDLGGAQECAFLTSSQVILEPLVGIPHVTDQQSCKLIVVCAASDCKTVWEGRGHEGVAGVSV